MKYSYCFSVLCLLLIFFHVTTICLAQSAASTKADKIDKLISTYAEYGKFNGSILVSEKGSVIYKKGFGLANMEWDSPNQTDTKFRLASVSKQFTSMLVMQLVAEGKLDLTIPVSTYLPDYPKETGDQITLHHLLSHTSGIPNYTSFDNYWDIMKNHMEPIELVNMFADSSLLFAPGDRFSYSNSGYALVGYLMETITGQAYADLLQEKIFAPLNMLNSGYFDDNTILKNKAAGYDNNLGNFTNSRYIDLSIGYTAGGLYSTVEDLYLWDQALYTEQLLPQEFLDKLMHKHIPAWGGYYGYGWHQSSLRLGNSEERLPTAEHDGVINGFNTMIMRIPSDQSSIIILNNTGGAPLYEMRDAIGGILYDQTYDFPKQSIADALLKVILKDGLDEGLTFYQKVKNDDNYALDERELNLAGYHLMQSDRTKEAATIFELNIEAHPNSFNAYDSYAESLNEIGNKAEAIKNYKKSLSLNPKNENGIQMLEQLGVTVDRASLYLLQTGDTWGKEIFTFPLRFASDLNYKGKEEAHFPRGWRNQDSEEFWSYAFVWSINKKDQPSESQLENDLQIYFDGLLNAVNKNMDKVLPKTVAKLSRQESSMANTTFVGELEIFDTFITNEALTLNVNVKTRQCEAEGKTILQFLFSPAGIDAEIWTTLKGFELRKDYCEE